MMTRRSPSRLPMGCLAVSMMMMASLATASPSPSDGLSDQTISLVRANMLQTSNLRYYIDLIIHLDFISQFNAFI